MLNRRRKRINRFQNGGISNNYPRRRGYVNDNLGNGYEDDVPAMLTAGEYVLRRSSVQKYGETFLNRLNQGLVSNDVRYMNNGGQVTNGRNDMRRNNSRRRSNRRPINRNTGGSVSYQSRNSRTSARRTTAPNRPRRVGSTVPQRARRNVRGYYHGGTVHNGNGGSMMGNGSRTMMTRRQGTAIMPGMGATVESSRRPGTRHLTKYNDKYYDCKGSKFITTDCSEVADTQLFDPKIGKHGNISGRRR